MALESSPRYVSTGFLARVFEGRCKMLDHVVGGGTQYRDTYNIMYRNFSRNVHSTDLTDLFITIQPSTITTARAHDLIESRDGVACSLVTGTVLTMVSMLNDEFKLGLNTRITLLTKLRDGHRGVPG